MEAFREFGITRLASRIYELRQKGVEIIAESVTAKNRYDEPVRFARYRMA
jgi:putative N-acetylmannosamine-6-phosphate epimerase